MGPDADSRVASILEDADLTGVADAMARGRDQILQRWLEAAARQPFHSEHPEGAVADHIPALFDATVGLLRRDAETPGSPTAPLDDPAVAEAATAHARVRFEQGLGTVSVVTEFRLLRQEIFVGLREGVDEHIRPSDVVAGLAIVGDALDGAATVSLTALSDRIEGLRESFLATTLHDIRQPITLVEGALHLAERWLAAPDLNDERLRETIGDAMSATSELVAIVDTLSDASRVAMGALHPDPEPASLERIVREVLGALGATARGRVAFSLLDGGHLIGLWDPGLLHRLVANLVGNALKYSEPGGIVRVEVGPGSPGLARLVVADEGLGMTAEEIATVFDRFVRADRVRRNHIPGLGLGLYACRGIVVAHGGTIDIRSDGAGQGTTVEVHLPLLDEAIGD